MASTDEGPTQFSELCQPELRLGSNPVESLGLNQAHQHFIPSRHRPLSATSLTASTGLQPTGRALPAIIPKGLLPDDHWQHACFHTCHPLAQLPDLPDSLLNAVWKLQSLGGGVVEWRAKQLLRVRALAEALRPAQVQWQQSLHPQVRKTIGSWHMPLMHILAKEAGSADLFFNLDYTVGARCVGRAQHSFVMPLKVTQPRLTVQGLLDQAPARNQQLLAAIRSSGDVELDKASLNKTQKEIESGAMSGPWPASHLPPCIAVVSRRFPIWEHYGAQAQKKCRNIDEMSESMLNATVEDYETYSPKGIEHILALVRLLRHSFGASIELAGFTADFKAAYRQIALCPSQYKFQGVAWWDCARQEVMVGLLTALAFGSRRAPANWGRLVLRLVDIARFHLNLLVLDYVDDVNGVEPAFSAESARKAWIELIDLLGLKLDLDKTSRVAAPEFDSLGVHFTLNDPQGVVEILPSRAASLQADIRLILEADSLCPGQAARLRGKLGFAVVAAFGRFGRAQMSAIKRRQYAPPSKDFKLTKVLRAQLRWWLQRLSCLPPRSIPRHPATKFLVAYSDGEGSGQIAVCLTHIDRAHTEFCCTAVPHNVLNRWKGSQHIHRIEALGPAICFLTWPRSVSGQLLLFFIDNQSAQGSMIGGWSNETVLNDITALSWALAADLHCFVFFEYVESAANIIDGASRAFSPSDLEPYRQRGWSETKAVTPWHLLPCD